MTLGVLFISLIYDFARSYFVLLIIFAFVFNTFSMNCIIFRRTLSIFKSSLEREVVVTVF